MSVLESENEDNATRKPRILCAPKLRKKASSEPQKRPAVLTSTAEGQTLSKQPKIESESFENSTPALKYLSQPTEDNFTGPADFSFHFPPTDSFAASTWDYSRELNYVFIRLEKILLVHFKFDRSKLPDKRDVFVRAVLIFRSPDYLQDPVNRCSMHWVVDDPGSLAHKEKNVCKCTQYNLTGHVIRSPNPETTYCFDPASGRHSITTPVQHKSDGMYSFSCQNSCPKGMDRRAVKLVFSLENSRGDVFGRASVSIKICCCPKRDREKLEKELFKPTPPTTALSQPRTLSVKGQKDAVKQALAAQLNELKTINSSLKARCRVIEEALKLYCEKNIT